MLLRKGSDSIFKNSSSSLQDFFSKNLFLRAQLEDLSGADNSKSIPSIFALKAEK